MTKKFGVKKLLLVHALLVTPIDLLSGDKYEFAVDYASPNGLLRVERRYTDQKHRLE